MGYLNNRIRLALFASGSGSNAERICEYFLKHPQVEVALIYSNKNNAGVFKRLKSYGIPYAHLENKESAKGKNLLALMNQNQIDFIALAGYLRLIPKELVEAYPNRIVNIHPALLPQYGGKGMYGHHVHKAVYDAGETYSGLTIHFVNEKFDEGNHICQVKTEIKGLKTADEIAAKVLRLEHQYYAAILEQVALSTIF